MVRLLGWRYIQVCRLMTGRLVTVPGMWPIVVCCHASLWQFSACVTGGSWIGCPKRFGISDLSKFELLPTHHACRGGEAFAHVCGSCLIWIHFSAALMVVTVLPTMQTIEPGPLTLVRVVSRRRGCIRIKAVDQRREGRAWSDFSLM